MNNVIRASFASVVSELQQSDIFMTVKARLFETPKANLNGVRVTPAFLDEVIKNEEKYVGLPLVADVKALANGRYDHLGHLYDAKTGQFHTTQIGSFYKFEREDFDGGAYLVGYARIAKRNKHICRAVLELFADNALKFSFEISCGEYTKREDGTTEIDVADCNFLEGEAIVTFPACEDAIALDLVAECDRIADGIQEGEKNMADENKILEIAEETEEAECNRKKKAEEAEEEQQEVEDEKETATVYVTKEHVETEVVNIYDSDTGEETTERITVETRVLENDNANPGFIAEEADGGEDAGDGGNTDAGDGEQGAGDGDNTDPDAGDGEQGESGGTDPGSGDPEPGEGGGTDPEPEPTIDTDDMVVNVEDDGKKQIGEAIIRDLRESIENLRKEIAELREQKASKQNVTINPFIASNDDGLNIKQKYSLLEKAETKQTFSLLEKA